MNLVAWVKGKLQARRAGTQLMQSVQGKLSKMDNAQQGYPLVPGYARIMSEAERLLLENARNNWLSENWEALVAIERQDYEDHPERAKLALLNAAGHFQVGSLPVARECVALALRWGSDNNKIKQILLNGLEKSVKSIKGSLVF